MERPMPAHIAIFRISPSGIAKETTAMSTMLIPVMYKVGILNSFASGRKCNPTITAIVIGIICARCVEIRKSTVPPAKRNSQTTMLLNAHPNILEDCKSTVAPMRRRINRTLEINQLRMASARTVTVGLQNLAAEPTNATLQNIQPAPANEPNRAARARFRMRARDSISVE